LFNGLGQVHLLLPIKEKAGIVRYAIFVHGTGPEGETPDSEMEGLTIIEIEIAENPLLNELNDDIISSSEIPAWIKNNAGWWADGQITDDDFVKGIQFLIKEKILNVPATTPGTSTDSNEIPAWIKNNAGWWADGQITDDDFVKGIQYLVEQGIILV
jgi:hypothetical protein